jgi:nucleoid DNA-binding protein
MKPKARKVNLDAIIRQVSSTVGLPLNETGELISALCDTIKQGLLKHETIELRGFGTFKVRFRKEKWARNVRKNTKVFVPDHYSPVFIPGKIMKDAINKNPPDAGKN